MYTNLGFCIFTYVGYSIKNYENKVHIWKTILFLKRSSLVCIGINNLCHWRCFLTLAAIRSGLIRHRADTRMSTCAIGDTVSAMLTVNITAGIICTKITKSIICRNSSAQTGIASLTQSKTKQLIYMYYKKE